TQGPVAGQVVYSSGSRTATFTPDAPLDEGQSYTVTLTNAVKDQSGQTLLNAPVTWTFRFSNVLFLYLPAIQR
ncbi:MAG TPA: Ig-like domain-containing protein, partial [Planococcus sp. (in: firmicutes)]|nr:Ig-like domain-containing protein [Planococcus sp. (in: firmicutes)]